MAIETTYDTETELSSVNSILGAIGQSPVTSLDAGNPEISYVYQLLMESQTDLQNEGWVWNREFHYEINPEANNGRIPELADDAKIIVIPPNILRIDMYANHINRTTDYVRRNGCVYDKLNHTYEFDKSIHANIVWKLPYEDLPSVFKRYATIRASVRAATQMVTNKELAQLLATQEAYARASCIEYESNQGDYTIFGTPDNTMYRSYQPYRALAR